MQGTIFNIQRFSLHDGPGIRTIIFFKGCALRCKWCSNPESHSPKPQILFVPMNCIHCNRCVQVCPKNAISVKDGKKVIDYNKCDMCGLCIENCCSGALEMSGRKVGVEELIQELKKDSVYYSQSGGGITLSGGETLLQPDFAAELLKACKQEGWNTAIETANFANRNALEKVMPYADLFLADLKIFDSEKHKYYTGQSNEKIIENIKYIAQSDKKIIIRIPIIPSVNDDVENMYNTVKFANSIGIKEINLLPYHRLGINKYSYLGYDYSLNEILPPPKEKMQELKRIVENAGIKCKIGG